MIKGNLFITLTEEYPYCKFILNDYSSGLYSSKCSWCIMDTPDGIGNVSYINAEKYSLTQAIELFENQLKQNNEYTSKKYKNNDTTK